MGGGARYFLIDRTGEVVQLPTATFHRMVASKDAARLPEFAGARVPCVEVHLRSGRTGEFTLEHVAAFYLRFDHAGALDLDDLRKQIPALLPSSHRGPRRGMDVPRVTAGQAAIATDAALGRRRVQRLRAAPGGGLSPSHRRPRQAAPSRATSKS